MGEELISAETMAQKTWQMENNIVDLDSAFTYDPDEVRVDEEGYGMNGHLQQRAILGAKPWERDAHYFKEVRYVTRPHCWLGQNVKRVITIFSITGEDLRGRPAQDGDACEERRQHRGEHLHPEV